MESNRGRAEVCNLLAHGRLAMFDIEKEKLRVNLNLNLIYQSVKIQEQSEP